MARFSLSPLNSALIFEPIFQKFDADIESFRRKLFNFSLEVVLVVERSYSPYLKMFQQKEPSYFRDIDRHTNQLYIEVQW
jgi:hypothetical protein